MDWLKLIGVSGAVVAMLFGLYQVFAGLKARGSGFGRDSLRAIGLVLFLPSLVILAITTAFKPETIAALLGTVAGYVLSSSGPAPSTPVPPAPPPPVTTSASN
jgi:hypothetical protein